MTTRRQFLSRTTGFLALGTAWSALGLAGDDRSAKSLPDGSAARGMITPSTEQAIERGLAYLKSHRWPNGSFGTGQYVNNVAITSLAALAFMAGGHQPGRGAYGQVVTDALRTVLDQEDKARPGYLYSSSRSHQAPMYGHGFGTLFLAEVCGMVPDPRLRSEVRETLRRAVDVILNAQNREGGWRYTPEPDQADISVTICQIMALRAARNAGIAVPKSKVDACVQYVKNCQDRREGWFRYQAQVNSRASQPAFARTAAGVCALYIAGIYDGPEIKAGLGYLMDRIPRGSGFVPRYDTHYFYGHYYAAQVMWTAGGEYWAKWFPAIRDELLLRQRQDGSWQDMTCTHYGTAMACIMLQIPNNYLPILQK